MAFDFDNSYARLPPRFYVRQAPVPVAAPRLIHLNQALALDLGLDPLWLGSPEGVAVLAGNRLAPGMEPIAMAYAGHQFGGFVPQLGDGRAILLGEILDPRGGRFDIQLKGSGRTPFSRGGDGRAWLGPVLRELIIGEAMHALGIPTTRALAAVTTGEAVHREAPFPGAVLTRVARGHVRVGTFEYFAAKADTPALRTLADYVIARHYPEVMGSERPYRAFLDAVIARQADLVAQWLAVGFIHGVMNTDNMSIAGETIDYGPCAFMDTYDPGTVYSSIDRSGRYAYGNQPRIAHWNLSRLAECLLPLLGEDREGALQEAQDAIDAFPGCFERAYLGRFCAKLGLDSPQPDDPELVADLLQVMAETGADFTNGFRALCDAAQGDASALRAELGAGQALDRWLQRWRQRRVADCVEPGERAARMRRVNPGVIPRNHRVESVLAAALEDDLGPLHALLRVLAAPWDPDPDNLAYRAPPQPHEVVHQTFCGT